jgi:hypothetical protein
MERIFHESSLASVKLATHKYQKRRVDGLKVAVLRKGRANLKGIRPE